MNSFPSKPLATHLSFDTNNMQIEFTDGRILIIPLVYFPRLLNAKPGQREHYIISGGGTGLHWEELNEDLLVKNLLLGIFDQSLPNSTAA
jgi:hypothetical protein